MVRVFALLIFSAALGGLAVGFQLDVLGAVFETLVGVLFTLLGLWLSPLSRLVDPTRSARPREADRHPAPHPRPGGMLARVHRPIAARHGRARHPEKDRRGAAHPEPEGYAPTGCAVAAIRGEAAEFIDYALRACRERRASLHVVYVRPFAVAAIAPGAIPGLGDDAEARATFDRIRLRARQDGVPVDLWYTVGRGVAGPLLDAAAAHGADLLVMQADRRGALARAFFGDDVREVLSRLPTGSDLLIHAPAAARPPRGAAAGLSAWLAAAAADCIARGA